MDQIERQIKIKYKVVSIFIRARQHNKKKDISTKAESGRIF